MAEQAGDPKDRQWSMNEWCWDPYNMLALASDSKNAGAASKPAAPFPFGAGPYASQAHLAPAASLLLDEVSRGAARGRGPATCQVAGCSADLTTLKEYHQRYKICEFHLKVSSIIREGKRQRFCQQCGRFHDLTSFDGDKRSCRARLQRHNARRRKKTTDVDAPSASKPATVKRQSSIGRGSRTDSSKKQQTSDSASIETKQDSLGARDGSFETESHQQQLRQSLRASPERRRRAMHPPLGEESGSQLAARLNSSTFGTEQMQMPYQSQALQAERRSSSDLPPSFPAMEMGQDGSMESLDGLDMGLFAAQQSNSMPDYSDLTQAASQLQSTGFGADQSGASTATAASLVDEARAMLTFSGQNQAAEYTSEEHLTRMSAKLFKCTPQQLPGDLKANLLAMLQCGVNALEGYIRPGCLHLTLNAMVGTQLESHLKAMDVRGLFNHLVAYSSRALWSSDTLVLQWYDEAALVRDGKIMHVLSAAGSRGVLPQLHCVSPVALHAAAPERLLLTGQNLAVVDNRVLARCQGHDVALEVVSSGFQNFEGTAEPLSYVEVKVSDKQHAGLLHVEVARGSLLSQSKPVLMLDRADVAADINRLRGLKQQGVDMDGLLLDLGRVLELKQAIAAAKTGTSVPVRSYSATDIADMAQLARRQLRLAIDAACVSLATYVLPVAAADAQTMAEAVQSIEAALDMPLLLRAVRSQSVPLVQMVLEWTSAVGVDLLAGKPGPHGLTALHMAAVMENGAKLAALLTDVCPDGISAWTAAGACGASPAELAFASGNRATHDHVLQQLHNSLAAASADPTEDTELEEEGDEDELAVNSETGELLDADVECPLDSTAEDAPADTAVAPPTEEALHKLSLARKQEGAAPTCCKLRHTGSSITTTSSLTTSSSLYTSSMSSTDTVLHKDPAALPSYELQSRAVCASTPQQMPMPRRMMGHPQEACDRTGKERDERRDPHDGSGRAGHGFSYDTITKPGLKGGGAAPFPDVKVAPTVFDGTHALGSALLIGACGGLTLLLRYCGTTFLD